MNDELYLLAKERLSELHEEEIVSMPYRSFFRRTAFFLLELCRIGEEIETESDKWSLSDWRNVNVLLYADIRGELYEASFANPDFAVSTVGKKFGTFFSFIYMQMRSCIPDVFEGNRDRLLRHIHYFLGLYSTFCEAAQEKKTEPDFETVRDGLIDFVLYLYEEEANDNVLSKVDPDQDFAYRIIMESDFADLSYLYRFGEYISEDVCKTATYIGSLPEETLRLMADTYTEGYRIGFEKAGKDLSKKGAVQIIYPLGFEPMIKLAIANFKEMGLRPVIRRETVSLTEKRYGSSYGYYSENPNRQCEYDHREDAAFFLNKKVCEKRLQFLKAAFEEHKEKSRAVAGPAVVETFGEELFHPVNKKTAAAFNEKQRDLEASYYSEAAAITNKYIPGDERSFTIIAFPLPQIGEEYPKIMEDVIRLNTLDWRLYEKIQQTMIDSLDTCNAVYIKGKDGNETDLRLSLIPLSDPEKETIFENCVADVNIPVGEVFTSPVLAGTNGVLHVKRVFLNGLEYRDLRFTIKEGRVVDYGCANFESEEECRTLIESRILHHHKNVPLGELAIGTNTTAYKMAKEYDIEDKLPILIAEKTGPHIAIGDTCYSYNEDMKVYNTDGKEIIARDNEISILRKSEDESQRKKAYYHCHTDVTIPYEELAVLYGETKDGQRITILEDGRFVLPGTEELNKPLD
ncbi:MAG: aminopeptidase [Lachnospiraceae bacterium]|nr:aminopeptidase [Lachnospiraceae bacterium]